jgi:hypothetical protein
LRRRDIPKAKALLYRITIATRGGHTDTVIADKYRFATPYIGIDSVH